MKYQAQKLKCRFFLNISEGKAKCMIYHLKTDTYLQVYYTPENSYLKIFLYRRSMTSLCSHKIQDRISTLHIDGMETIN